MQHAVSKSDFADDHVSLKVISKSERPVASVKDCRASRSEQNVEQPMFFNVTEIMEYQ